jgi:uncharacterized spore protein YtfJ
MEKEFGRISEAIPDQKAANELMEKLFDVSKPDSVFSPPIESGEYKIITASEVTAGLGYGYGGGGGFGNGAQLDEDEDQAPDTGSGFGAGGGGGGGGGAMARPVAAIEIGPNGVRVEPIVDPTKIALAFFTTLIGMFAMLSKMRRSGR